MLSSFSRTTNIDVGVRKSQSEQNFCRNFQTEKEKEKEEKAANVIAKSFSEQFLLDTNYERKKRQVKEDEEEEGEVDGKQLLQTLNQNVLNVFAKIGILCLNNFTVIGSKQLWCFSFSVSLEFF